jgi:hypothetical protein
MKKVRDISRGNRRRFGTPDLESTTPSSPLPRHHRYLPSSSSSSTYQHHQHHGFAAAFESNCIYPEYQPRRQQRREAKSGKGRAVGCKWWWMLQEQTKTGVAERQQRLPNIPSGRRVLHSTPNFPPPKKGFSFSFLPFHFLPTLPTLCTC